MFQFEKQKLESFLKARRYPIDRQGLIREAEKNLPHQIVLLLQRLEDRSYSSPEEVDQAMAAHHA